MQAAVPQRIIAALETEKSATAPGHEFSIYFPIWDTRWKMDSKGKKEALNKCLCFASVESLARSIRERQLMTASALPAASSLVVDAESTSPFATGLGIEHPVENGFAFLSPYGIPYLAGSGVKGVLRRAAEDLAAHGELTRTQVELLFGTDNQSPEGQQAATDDQLKRGVLTFWDVFPLPPAKVVTGIEQPRRLSVEVMTAHHSGYLQKGQSPNDSESPTPIPFLAVPPRSAFRFVVTCQTFRIQNDALPSPWRVIVNRLFEDAFALLGFGAKTAVGYGAMRSLSQAEVARERQETAKAAAKCLWVDQTLNRLNKPGVQEPLFGKTLAEEWTKLDDPAVKSAALQYIKALWGDEWNAPRGGGRKKARAIYEGNA